MDASKRQLILTSEEPSAYPTRGPLDSFFIGPVIQTGVYNPYASNPSR